MEFETKAYTYPETLLATKIGMPGIPPESTGDEATFRIIRSPLEPCTWPLIHWVVDFRFDIYFLFSQIGVLVRMKCKLLIVRNKFKSKDGKGSCGKNIIRGDEGCMRLEDRGSVCG